jgi:hypothetical protein
LWGTRQLLIESVSVTKQRYMMVEMVCTLLQGDYSDDDAPTNAFPYTFPFELS